MHHTEPDLLIELDSACDWPGFRQACRVLLAEGIAPHEVRWCWPESRAGQAVLSTDLFSANAAHAVAGQALTPQMLERLPQRQARPLRVPKQALRTLQNASLHHDPARFELCHRWLDGVQANPQRAADVLDADWCTLARMAHAVGRGIHKMHAFVRFRTTQRAGQPNLHVAWFEPEHHIVEAAAPFFVRRFANMHWAILTPLRCLHWDGQQLHLAPGARASDAPPADAGEALWLTYYASTFNPARLKEAAMQREMPRKYWRNLPETVLISPLVQQARSRTERMLRDAQAGLLT